MFREMRRSERALSQEACEDILNRGEVCVLALAGDDGYPYAVPVNYCYVNGKIYIHCAKEGHKLDSIRRCDKGSLTVIDCAEILPEKHSTHYESVIAFGRFRILADEGEALAAIEAFSLRHSPNVSETEREKVIAHWLPSVAIIEFTPEYMSGKHSRY